MIERSQDLGLSLKTIDLFGIFRDIRRQDFDGNQASEFGVARAIDLSHAADAQWRDDFIRPQSSSRQKAQPMLLRRVAEL